MLDPEGWVHLRLHVEWPDEVAHAMLRLGSGVEVLEPREVREQIVATTQRILDRYGEAAVMEETAAVAVGGSIDRGQVMHTPSGSPAAR